MLGKLVDFFIGHAIVFILNLVSYPLITRLISPIEMGKYSMNLTMVSLAQIICVIGMDQSFVRYFYDQSEKTRPAFLKKCMFLPGIILGVLTIMIFIFGKAISSYIINGQSILFIVLFTTQIAASVFVLFIQLYIRMEQRARLYSILNIAMKSAYLLFILLFFKAFHSNCFTLIAANTASLLITLIFGSFKINTNVLEKHSQVMIKTNYASILRYSLPFVLSTGIIWLFNSVDKIMLRQFAGYEEMGIYSGAMALVNMLNLLQGAFTSFWVPVAFEKYKNHPEDRFFFSQINRLVSFFMLTVATVLIVCKDVISLFLGPEYHKASFVFPYLIFMPIMYTISETTVVGINFKEKSYLHIIVSMISTICNVIGNFLLVPHFGAKGAAIATGLSYVIFFFSRTILSIKCYKTNYSVKRFIICCTGVYLLAIYASFHTFDIVIFAVFLINIFIIGFLYRDAIFIIFNYIKNKKLHLNKS